MLCFAGKPVDLRFKRCRVKVFHKKGYWLVLLMVVNTLSRKLLRPKYFLVLFFKLSPHYESLKDKYLHFIDESRKQVIGFKKNVVD